MKLQVNNKQHNNNRNIYQRQRSGIALWKETTENNLGDEFGIMRKQLNLGDT